MIYRLLSLCFLLGCFTILISLQQTYWNGKNRKDAISRSQLSRVQFIEEQNNINEFEHKFLDPKKHGMVLPREELLKNYYQELFASKSFVSSKFKMKGNDFNMNFILLPVLYYNMGPNNLFRIFKETVVFGYMMNFSLVTPQFHHHPRMKRLQEAKRGLKTFDKAVNIDIFDQKYESSLEQSPEKIIDIKSLNQLIPTLTMQEFQMKCSNRLNSLIICGELGEKRKAGLEHFKKTSKLSITQTYSVAEIYDLLNKKPMNKILPNLISNPNEKNCFGLALGSRCLGSRPAWFKKWKKFSTFVRRPADTVILAKRFVASVFHNQPFLAVHWRYETKDWQDMCKSTRPATVRRVNEPTCKLAKQFEQNNTFLDSFATRLQIHAKKYQLKFIYFAAPPQLTSIIKQLQKKVVGLYYISDVARFARYNFIMEDIFDNNFSASFLEQEICHMSKQFLGSPLSSWTQTVMVDRFVEDRDNHDSVLNLIDEENNEFPTLRWYFPEGE